MASDPVLARLRQLHPRLIDLSLDRLQRLLDALDHPERKLPPVIHVAGTNGKGSVCAYMRAMYEAAGKRAHVYTSPHLVRFHERIRLAGTLIDDDYLTECFERAERANAGLAITEFEIVTAAAFLAFAETPADVLILEVGLGGRYDATNVVERPAATAITSVSLDHQNFFGDKLDRIAWEKAGILKPGVLGAIGPQVPDALAMIERCAQEVGAPLQVWGRDFSAELVGGDLESPPPLRGKVRVGGAGLLYRSMSGEQQLPVPALPGAHQVGNSAVAITIAKHLGLADEAIAAGLRQVEWPARLQRLSGPLLDRLPAGSELWLDGGHNPAAGEVLATTIATWEPMPLELIVGMLNTKPPAEFLTPLAALGPRVHAVGIEGEPNGRPASDIAAAASGLGLQVVESGLFTNALDSIAKRAGAPPRVLICGSLYLAGQVLAALVPGVKPPS
jgi:dihydrofolate synthase / folylpolyglutamate synthase